MGSGRVADAAVARAHKPVPNVLHVLGHLRVLIFLTLLLACMSSCGEGALDGVGEGEGSPPPTQDEKPGPPSFSSDIKQKPDFHPTPGACGSNHINNEFLRCISQMSSCLQMMDGSASTRKGNETSAPVKVKTTTANPLDPNAAAGVAPTFRCKKADQVGNDTATKCRFRWLNQSQWFSGWEKTVEVSNGGDVEKGVEGRNGNEPDQPLKSSAEAPQQFDGIRRVIFVGDSTIMRDYMHAVNASAKHYTTKVAKLETGFLRGLLKLDRVTGRASPVSSADEEQGRGQRHPTGLGDTVEVLFFRLLHISHCSEVVEKVFNASDRHTMIVLTIGPHDTSWLVFRRPMPFFKKTSVGRWDHAMAYWRRYSQRLVGHFGARLQQFGPDAAQRPFVVLREQYWANCNHPKYSRYPLITRCKDLLLPKVIPYYRTYSQAAFGAIGIPVVGIDPFFSPGYCHLVDAGHVNRWPCKTLELGMLFLTYRLGREAGVIQGFTTPSGSNGTKKQPGPKVCDNVLDAWPGPFEWGVYLDNITMQPHSRLPITPKLRGARWGEAVVSVMDDGLDVNSSTAAPSVDPEQRNISMPTTPSPLEKREALNREDVGGEVGSGGLGSTTKAVERAVSVPPVSLDSTSSGLKVTGRTLRVEYLAHAANRSDRAAVVGTDDGWTLQLVAAVVMLGCIVWLWWESTRRRGGHHA